MIKRIFLKNLIPVVFICKVFDHNELELFLPLGMEGVDFLNEALATDGADDVVAGGDERVYHMGTHKGVCAGEKSAGHFYL